MEIDYDHAANLHTLEGAAAALATVFDKSVPRSLLDVGAGTGTWLRAASDLGVSDVFGIDGVIPEKFLHVDRNTIVRRDLSVAFDLGRRFDMALSLEVAEHLPEASAPVFVASILRHADLILFSAAAPNQWGQHHINCQWPAYWQRFFNDNGFVCDDSVRWQLWSDQRIEPWYRQNVFLAHRFPEKAGKEARIKPVIHPEMLRIMSMGPIRNGSYPLKWYFKVTARVAATKLGRKLNIFRQRSS
jgi:SAM-dependent methyltransferase